MNPSEIEAARAIKVCDQWLTPRLKEAFIRQNLREATYAVPRSKFPPLPLPKL